MNDLDHIGDINGDDHADDEQTSGALEEGILVNEGEVGDEGGGEIVKATDLNLTNTQDVSMSEDEGDESSAEQQSPPNNINTSNQQGRKRRQLLYIAILGTSIIGLIIGVTFIFKRTPSDSDDNATTTTIEGTDDAQSSGGGLLRSTNAPSLTPPIQETSPAK